MVLVLVLLVVDAGGPLELHLQLKDIVQTGQSTTPSRFAGTTFTTADAGYNLK